MNEAPCQHCGQPTAWNHTTKGFTHTANGLAACPTLAKTPCVLCARPTIHRADHIDVDAGRPVTIGSPVCAAPGACAARQASARQARNDAMPLPAELPEGPARFSEDEGPCVECGNITFGTVDDYNGPGTGLVHLCYSPCPARAYDDARNLHDRVLAAHDIDN